MNPHWLRVPVTIAVAAAVISPLIGVALAQVPVEIPPVSFEAASVRPNRSGDRASTMNRQPGGRLAAVNVPLRRLITFAYQIQPFQLIGGSGWITSDMFDIVAKMDGAPPANPGQEPMVLAMRTLLAERFGLVVHRETREMDIYALVLARADGRPGPALRQSTSDCSPPTPGARSGAPETSRGQRPPREVRCGGNQTFGRMQFGGLPLSQFANSLSVQVQRVVRDRTGLTGNWDLDLTFAPESPAPGVETPIDAGAPSLFTAVQEQLGLKLQPTRGPVEVLVIDRASPPTPD